VANWVGLVDRDRYPEADGLPDTAIEDATQAVLNYTDRDFIEAQVVETRTFRSVNPLTDTGEVIIDIDDCDEVYDVAGLSDNNWRAGTDGPAASFGIYTYIEVALLRASSALMGFTSNLDVFGNPFWGEVDVSARWGWPSTVVPEDVQRATLIAAYELEGDSQNLSGQLASKTVAEVTESYRPSVFQPQPESLPTRVIVLLDPWRRRSL
jgi:hypothetical protein